MFNVNNLSKLFLVFAIFFVGCKEFIEPSLEKKKVTLLAPANGAEGRIYDQTFWWEEVDDAVKYRLQVVTPNFDQPLRLVLDTLIERNRFNHSFTPGNFQWRVRAENGSSKSTYTTASFTIHPGAIEEQQVQLSLPLNHTLTNQPNAVFKWLKLYGCDQYRIQLDTNNFVDENTLFLDKTISGLELPVTFTKDKVYQWRVKGSNGTNDSKWSVIQDVIFDKTPPGKVVLTAPLNNQSVAKPATLRWELLTGAKKYLLYIYKNESGNPYSSKYPLSLTTGSYVFSEGLSSEKVYWEVKAVDEVGNVGQVSELRSFLIQ